MNASEFKDVFAAEAHEYLQALNRDLLRLENNPENLDVIDDMFRAAHSLKGMSSTMGYQELADFTHQIESVLDLLRNTELTATESVVNILFNAIDSLEELLNKTLLDQELPNLIQVTSELRQLQRTQLPSNNQVKDSTSQPSIDIELDEFDHEAVALSIDDGYIPYKIIVRLRPKTLLKSVRVYTVFQALEKFGTIIKCNPSSQDLEDEKFDLEFAIIFLSKEDETILREAVESLSEIDQVIVTKFELDEYAEENLKQETASSQEVIGEFPVENREMVSSRATNAIHSRTHFADRYIRVETDRLDNLINLVGELVISKTQVNEIQTENLVSDHTKNALVQLDRITTELQYAAMKLRMVPIKQVFDRFPRLVRDLAQNYNKDIQLEIIGEETELDRSLVNQIGDPLVHLIRNSIDHGIGTTEERLELGKSSKATLRLSAYHEGGHVIIQVYDDGRGLNVEKIIQTAYDKGLLAANSNIEPTMEQAIEIIFTPGFSTNTTITDVSGRGVGMDVVKNAVEALSGEVKIESKQGEFTCTTIKLPLTLAIIKALLITCHNQTYAMPIQSVRENLLVTFDQIKTVSQQKVIVIRDEILPLYDLTEVMYADKPEHEDIISVIVVESQGEKLGFIVDDIIGQQEIVIKSLPESLGEISGISGATVLGNGDVALIIDHNTLIKGRSEAVV